jgi:hypothetical protein
MKRLLLSGALTLGLPGLLSGPASAGILRSHSGGGHGAMTFEITDIF